MVWLAFLAGLVIGVFSGVLVLGLIRELAASRSTVCAREPATEEAPAIPAPLGARVPSQA